MWRHGSGNHAMQGTRCAKVIFIDLVGVEKNNQQPPKNPKNKIENHLLILCHSVLQGTLLQLPQECLKPNQSQIMYFSSNLKLVNFIFCIFYNSLQLAHLPTEKAMRR